MSIGRAKWGYGRDKKSEIEGHRRNENTALLKEFKKYRLTCPGCAVQKEEMWVRGRQPGGHTLTRATGLKELFLWGSHNR